MGPWGFAMGIPLGTGGEQPERSAGEDQCGCGPCRDPAHPGRGARLAGDEIMIVLSWKHVVHKFKGRFFVNFV